MSFNTDNDLMLRRTPQYINYLRERVPFYLNMLTKKGPNGEVIPLGVMPLTKRQQYLMLRELHEAAILVEAGTAEASPQVAAYMQDVDAQMAFEKITQEFIDQGTADAT